MDAKEIGALVKREREARKLSLRGLAARADVGHNVIAVLERGEQKAPGYGKLVKIFAALDLPLSLLEEGGSTPGEEEDREFVEFRREWEMLPRAQRGLLLDIMRAIRFHAVPVRGVRVVGLADEEAAEENGRPHGLAQVASG